jgi:hypothetical protein
MVYSAAGGKLIHEKTRRNKSRVTVPLSKYTSVLGFLLSSNTHFYEVCLNILPLCVPSLPLCVHCA